MQQLTLMKDYKHNDPLRKSLSGLAESTFGISFERWYREGFWNERFIPFSYLTICTFSPTIRFSISIHGLVLFQKRSIFSVWTSAHPFRGQGGFEN